MLSAKARQVADECAEAAVSKVSSKEIGEFGNYFLSALSMKRGALERQIAATALAQAGDKPPPREIPDGPGMDSYDPLGMGLPYPCGLLNYY